jgi:small GTP-binding protein
MRDKEFKTTVPTVGLNIEHINYKRYSVTMWDVGGQATKLWKHYFDHINAVIFVVDSSDSERLLFSRDELNRLIKDESLMGVPFLIYYNKSDLKCMGKDELNKRLEIEELSQEREVAFQECSALTGDGIWEGVDRLIAMFEERKHVSDSGGAGANTADIENASTNKDSKPAIE